MKYISIFILLLLITIINAWDMGKSYCLACIETTDRYLYTGVQHGCRGVKRKCDIFGGNCDFCYIRKLEQEDLDLLQDYCRKGNGYTSINPKYKTFEVDYVNINKCSPL